MLDGRPADAETLPPPLVSVAGASDDEVVGETSLVAGTGSEFGATPESPWSPDAAHPVSIIVRRTVVAMAR
jgi:hypothetical protein